ncbi:hypothetical protein HZA76_01705 [Candidatus Roizmanbacteria bacterium]|nr:hypothetical protein [Candidatus Roizmanbacteria bacterium]
MNIIQKIIILISSFLLLIGAVILLLGILPGSIFMIYSILLITFSLFFIFVTSRVSKSDKSVKSMIKTEEVNPVLYSARSVFPFQIFPDHYIVQEKGLYIVRKTFFMTAWTEMIPIKDVASVRIYVGPFFASLTILRKILPTTSIELRNLWKKDAIKMKEVLDGLIMTEAELIDIPEHISTKTKKEILTEIGTEKEVEKEI